MSTPFIIGITGPAGSGKDTVAKMLRYSFQHCLRPRQTKTMALAEPIKQFCAVVFDWPNDRLFGESKLRDVPDADGLTPRHALQTLGTEWGRTLREDVWIDLLLRTINRHHDEQMQYRKQVVVYLVPDVRFPNEARRIREAGGLILRISGRNGNVGTEHASEQNFSSGELGAQVTHEINNSRDFDHLMSQVYWIVREIEDRLPDQALHV